MKPSVVRRGQDIRILTIVFDLCCAGKPIAKCEGRLPRSSEIPAVDITVDSASGQEIWVVGREVDVGDGPTMALERMLDGT